MNGQFNFHAYKVNLGIALRICWNSVKAVKFLANYWENDSRRLCLCVHLLLNMLPIEVNEIDWQTIGLNSWIECMVIVMVKYV